MIPKPIQRLAMEVVENARTYEKDKRVVKKNPEQWVTALLLTIKDALKRNRITAMLDSTVRYSFFEETMEEASRLLKRSRRQKINHTYKEKRP